MEIRYLRTILKWKKTPMLHIKVTEGTQPKIPVLIIFHHDSMGGFSSLYCFCVSHIFCIFHVLYL